MGKSQAGGLVQRTLPFEEAVVKAMDFALLEIEREAIEQSLYYHTSLHAKAVRRRARKIFQALLPFIEEILHEEVEADFLKRMQYLIDLCAIAHDLVQKFLPNSQTGGQRRRQTGASEAASSSKLIDYLEGLNRQQYQENLPLPALFTEGDKNLIQEAIKATICLTDRSSGDIYQPALYHQRKKLSLPAQIIALADLGCLGVEGIEAYRQEGKLIFLEENLDIISLLQENKQEEGEIIRQRLLKYVNFQLGFARGRQARFLREVAGLPPGAIALLQEEVFKYLTPETITTLEATTPADEDTSLEELIDFFELP